MDIFHVLSDPTTLRRLYDIHAPPRLLRSRRHGRRWWILLFCSYSVCTTTCGRSAMAFSNTLSSATPEWHKTELLSCSTPVLLLMVEIHTWRHSRRFSDCGLLHQYPGISGRSLIFDFGGRHWGWTLRLVTITRRPICWLLLYHYVRHFADSINGL